MSPQAFCCPSSLIAAAAAPCPSSFSHFYPTHSLWDSHTHILVTNTTPLVRAQSHIHMCSDTHTQTPTSFFVADIKPGKAAGSMQNNEVKAILIRLGMSPTQGGQQEWEMRKGKEYKKKGGSTTPGQIKPQHEAMRRSSWSFPLLKRHSRSLSCSYAELKIDGAFESNSCCFNWQEWRVQLWLARHSVVGYCFHSAMKIRIDAGFNFLWMRISWHFSI